MVRAQDVIIRTPQRRMSGRFSSFLQEHGEQLGASLVLVGLFGLLMFLTALMSRNAIEPVGTLSWDSQQAFISGPISCALEESFELQVTLTQQGVESLGSFSGPCLGGIERWTIAVSALAGSRLVPGPAQVCTVGTLRQQSSIIDLQRWCRNIALLSSETNE